jgi:hypothetical protein
MGIDPFELWSSRTIEHWLLGFEQDVLAQMFPADPDLVRE